MTVLLTRHVFGNQLWVYVPHLQL